MRSPPAGFQTAIASETVRIAEIYDFELQSGEMFYFTTHTKSIVWNSNTYTPLPLERGEIGYKLNLEADSVGVDMAGITGGFVSLLQANAVDNVEMTVRTVIWDDVTDPLMAMIEFQGTGDVEFDRRQVQFTFKSVLDNLNIVVPKNLYQEQCNNRLFDTPCDLLRSSHAYSGSASADGGDNFTLIDTVRGTAYKLAFDGGDEDNPIEVGDTITTVPPGPVGNLFDESSDGSCVALWRMEAGAGLVADTVGTNTLVNTGVTADPVNFFEGLGAGDFAADKLAITDVNLDVGMPWRVGAVSKDFTLCFRTRNEANSVERTLMYKNGGLGLRSFYVAQSKSRLQFILGYNAGVSQEYVQHSVTIDEDIWYSTGITYNDSTGAWRIRVKNEDTGVITETTGTFTNRISLTTADFQIGSTGSIMGDWQFDGQMDEVVVFDDVKTANELDQIFNQTYGKPIGNALVVAKSYVTASTGWIWYVELEGVQYVDDDVIEDSSGNSVVVNGTPAEDATCYALGEIEMTSGLNDGFRRMVVLQDEETLVIVNAFPNEIQSDDTYNLYPGCGQSSDACGNKFDNEPNYTGYLHVPKPEEAMT